MFDTARLCTCGDGAGEWADALDIAREHQARWWTAGATKKGGPPVRLAGPAPEANLDGRDERFRSGADQLPAVVDVHEVVFRGNPDD